MENRKFTTGIIRSFDRAKAEETREIEFVISDETRDRHGTVIPLDAWNIEKFNKNGIVGYQHEVHGSFIGDSNPDQVLGIGYAYVDDGKLVGRVTFEPPEINPLAEKIFQKVLHGTLKATSVGFMETQKGKYGEKEEARDGSNPTYYFGEVELLEFSIVNIPSNPNALRRNIYEETNIELLRMQVADLNDELETLENENIRLVAHNAQLETKITSLKQNLQIEKMNGRQRSLNKF